MAKQKVTEGHAKKVLREKWTSLMAADGVTSCGVGYEVKDGEQTDNICIQCTVDRKFSPEELSARDLTPLPEYVVGEDGTRVEVDVVQRRFDLSYEIRAVAEQEASTDFRALRRSRLEKLSPGASICNTKGTAGTLGAIVFDNETGQPLALSNWHVLHGASGAINDDIVQPGPFDDSQTSLNICGRLEKSHLGLAGDCAVASISSREWADSVIELDVVPRRVATPNLGDKVVKSGRTTGVTFGIVSRVGVVARLNYGGAVGSTDIGGFEIRPNPAKPADDGEISMGGDSGSVWLVDPDAANQADRDIVLGLHFAGEVSADPDDEHALACQITSVCDKLGVSFEPPSDVISDEGLLWREVFVRLEQLEATITAESTCQCSVEGAEPVVAEAGIPVHGNWCGPGHGSGTPKDSVDEACMHHDNCYDRDGYLNCDCDRVLVRQLDHAIRNGNLSSPLRNKARVIRAYFASAPCTRYVRIGGRRVPLPASNAVNNAGRAVGRAWNDVRRSVRRWF